MQSPRQSRVELPRKETRRRQQNLVGTLQLPHLRLQLLNLLRVACGGTRTLPGVDLGLLAPTTQRVDIHTDTSPDPRHRLVHRQLRILLPGLGHQPHRTLPQLLRILPRCWHDLHPLGGFRPSIKLGAVQINSTIQKLNPTTRSNPPPATPTPPTHPIHATGSANSAESR